MLWGFTLALLMGITLGFMAMSYRFDRSSRRRRLKGLSSYPLVSVIIPAYKSEKTIAGTLRSVRRSGYENTEIIVVNDSDDRTPQIARKFGARVIQNGSRLGKAAALNTAVEAASGEFLLILDADTTLQRSTITTLVRSYNSYDAAGEDVGIVAPKYAASNRHNFIARLSDMEQRLHQNLMKVQMNFGSILSIRGSCLLITRQAFQAAGGFSRTLLEDGDFTAKVIKADYKIKYEPRALAAINEPETLQSLLRAKKRYGKGTFYCAFRHWNPYIISPQSLVCFFPQFLLMVAVIGLLVFQNPLTLAPITMLLASFAFAGISSQALVVFIALASVIGVFIGSHAITAAQASTAKYGMAGGMAGTLLPFILFFVPLVTVAYARGFISGMLDKLHRRPELEFSNW